MSALRLPVFVLTRRSDQRTPSRPGRRKRSFVYLIIITNKDAGCEFPPPAFRKCNVPYIPTFRDVAVGRGSRRPPSAAWTPSSLSSVAAGKWQLLIKVGSAAPSKQTSLWRSRRDLVSLGVKDTGSWRGWVMGRRGMGRRVRMGGIVEEVG